MKGGCGGVPFRAQLRRVRKQLLDLLTEAVAFAHHRRKLVRRRLHRRRTLRRQRVDLRLQLRVAELQLLHLLLQLRAHTLRRLLRRARRRRLHHAALRRRLPQHLCVRLRPRGVRLRPHQRLLRRAAPLLQLRRARLRRRPLRLQRGRVRLRALEPRGVLGLAGSRRLHRPPRGLVRLRQRRHLLQQPAAQPLRRLQLAPHTRHLLLKAPVPRRRLPLPHLLLRTLLRATAAAQRQHLLRGAETVRRQRRHRRVHGGARPLEVEPRALLVLRQPRGRTRGAAHGVRLAAARGGGGKHLRLPVALGSGAVGEGGGELQVLLAQRVDGAFLVRHEHVHLLQPRLQRLWTVVLARRGAVVVVAAAG
eukprot:Rhum_TRINITY_DN14942_c4_g1::Rhum_TRINITY_DN14942_c4_g1_i1::g.126725::m.126725